MAAEALKQESSPLLSIEEMARELNVPVNTIYYWVHRNDIPHLKMGRHLRFQRDAVIAHFVEKTKAKRPPCRPLAELVQPRTWFGEKSPRSSLTFKREALLKRKE